MELIERCASIGARRKREIGDLLASTIYEGFSRNLVDGILSFEMFVTGEKRLENMIELRENRMWKGRGNIVGIVGMVDTVIGIVGMVDTVNNNVNIEYLGACVNVVRRI